MKQSDVFELKQAFTEGEILEVMFQFVDAYGRDTRRGQIRLSG
ncbi:hypothetical protein [Enterococcus sp. BWB1-3]|nr:hypothetical protein [Enterococcus sp. BWB1-3]